MRTLVFSLILISLLLCTACTKPGQTTGVAAATGGVIGAGLGAVVGNQTGDAGSGVVLGGVAGSATGAMVGNALEAQEDALRTQDEAIERQDRIIAKQQSEIDELRKMSQDNISFKGDSTRMERAPVEITGRGSLIESYPATEQPRKTETGVKEYLTYGNRQNMPVEPMQKERTPIEKAATRYTEAYGRGESYGQPRNRNEKPTMARSEERLEPLSTGTFGTRKSKSVEPSFAAGNLAEKNKARSLTEENQVTARSSLSWPNENRLVEKVIEEPKEAALSAECSRAKDEVKNAAAVDDMSEKLFHYRRALRLCPNDPSFHNGLGEVYLKLDRTEDAEFEFKEALKLNPDFQQARRNLQRSSMPDQY